jgi:hypothetical protein
VGPKRQHILGKIGRPNSEGVAFGERLQLVRQFVGSGHFRIIHENGNDADSGVESGDDFPSHHIVKGFKTAQSVRVSRRQPPGAYDRENHMSGSKLVLDGVRPIVSGSDAEVHECTIGAEFIGQPGMDCARLAGAVLATIANEKVRHRSFPASIVENG